MQNCHTKACYLDVFKCNLKELTTKRANSAHGQFEAHAQPCSVSLAWLRSGSA